MKTCGEPIGPYSKSIEMILLHILPTNSLERPSPFHNQNSPLSQSCLVTLLSCMMKSCACTYLACKLWRLWGYVPSLYPQGLAHNTCLISVYWMERIWLSSRSFLSYPVGSARAKLWLSLFYAGIPRGGYRHRLEQEALAALPGGLTDFPISVGKCKEL